MNTESERLTDRLEEWTEAWPVAEANGPEGMPSGPAWRLLRASNERSGGGSRACRSNEGLEA